MKRTITILLIVTLLVALTVPVYAAPVATPKEEVVYGILNHNGSVDKIYVVNHFNSKNIVDFGDYKDVLNLTTNDKITVKDNQITIDASEDSIYYQGLMTKNSLPWNITITYFLDGKEIEAKDLSGSSGKLEIRIDTKRNREINKFFYENYTLAINLNLDTDLCKNIVAPDAVIANAGRSKQLAFTILPKTEAQLVIKADVQDFKMEGMSISAIRMTMNIPIDANLITDKLSELTDAIKQLDDGSKDLVEGFTELSDGVTLYVEGMEAFNQAFGPLSKGVNDLKNGITAVSGGLGQLSQGSQMLVMASNAIKDETFQAVNDQLAQMQLQMPILTEENYTMILENAPQLAPIKQKLDDIVAYAKAIEMYTSTVGTLSQATYQLYNGATQLNDNMGNITQAANTLVQSAVSIQAGSKDFLEGLKEYNKGTNTLNKETANLKTQIQDEVETMVDSMFGTGEAIRSFVSDKNTEIESVQFVLKTPNIEAKDTGTDTPIVKPELTFWQKLLKLFGLYK